VLDTPEFQRRLVHIGIVVSAVVALLFGTLAYWQVFRADLAASQYNPRVLTTYTDPGRGRILDREGNVLVETLPGPVRTYHDQGLSHVLGYLSPRFGSQGVELAFNDLLAGREGRSWQAAFDAEFRRTHRSGLDVQLTIDPRVQQVAVSALADRAGAVVALDPRTGEVLAMHSNPGYDPGAMDAIGEQVFADPTSPILNRATQGLYPPGSTFKTIVAAAALEHGLVTPETLVTCEDFFIVEGFAVSCRNVPQGVGTYPFADAYAFSVNAIFAEVGVDLGWPRLLEMGRRFGFAEALPFTIDTSPNQLVGGGSDRSGPLLASTAFGQGELLVSPLQMAVVAATIANGGVLVSPRLGLRALEDGHDRGSIESSSERRMLSSEVAADLAAMMRLVVTNGQAAGVALDGIPVAGKTGTAEASEGTGSHAWFIAFAPYNEPVVAVAVVVELGGQGGVVASPIAGEVIRAAVAR
jgi:penicillin-binding protein A